MSVVPDACCAQPRLVAQKHGSLLLGAWSAAFGFHFFCVLDFLQDILGQILLRLLRTSLAEAVVERLTEFENMSFGLHEKAAF